MRGGRIYRFSSSSHSTPLEVISFIPDCSIAGIGNSSCGEENSLISVPNSCKSAFVFEIISCFIAKLSASSLKIRRLSSPVFRDSIKRDCLSSETPTTLAFIVFAPRLLSEFTKSESFPPFQLKEIVFSATWKVYLP